MVEDRIHQPKSYAVGYQLDTTIDHLALQRYGSLTIIWCTGPLPNRMSTVPVPTAHDVQSITDRRVYGTHPDRGLAYTRVQYARVGRNPQQSGPPKTAFLQTGGPGWTNGELLANCIGIMFDLFPICCHKGLQN